MRNLTAHFTKCRKMPRLRSSASHASASPICQRTMTMSLIYDEAGSGEKQDKKVAFEGNNARLVELLSAAAFRPCIVFLHNSWIQYLTGGMQAAACVCH